MVWDIIYFVLSVCGVYILLGAGCEYRNYSCHFLIRAFQAHNAYQKFFTLLYLRKNVDPYDMDRLTYIGFVGVVLSSLIALGILPFVIYTYFSGDTQTAAEIFKFWVYGSSAWGGLSVVIQIIDSLVCWIVMRIFDK
jgi:hypothetical protein